MGQAMHFYRVATRVALSEEANPSEVFDRVFTVRVGTGFEVDPKLSVYLADPDIDLLRIILEHAASIPLGSPKRLPLGAFRMPSTLGSFNQSPRVRAKYNFKLCNDRHYELGVSDADELKNFFISYFKEEGFRVTYDSGSARSYIAGVLDSGDKEWQPVFENESDWKKFAR